MAHFGITIRLGRKTGISERRDYCVQAGTSGKAINMVLANCDAVTTERWISYIFCEAMATPYTAERWKAIRDDLRTWGEDIAETPIYLPAEDMLPRHTERG